MSQERPSTASSFLVSPLQPRTAPTHPFGGVGSAEKADHLSAGFSAVMAYLSPMSFINRTLINLLLSASDARGNARDQPAISAAMNASSQPAYLRLPFRLAFSVVSA